MQIRTPVAILFIAVSTVSTWATAQNVYKCGDTYSQLPCPGGAVVDAADLRTSAQKTQSDLATSRDARTADAMEKARLQQEKTDLAANTPPAKPETTSTATNTHTPQVKKKKRSQPEYLGAQVPGKKNKKQATKKSAEKMNERKS